jgi:hypothetical protein
MNPRDKAILEALKLARKAVKLARNPKELAKAKANLKKLMDAGPTKNLKSLGSKVVQGIKNKVTKSNKELTKQLELLKKTKPKAKSKTPTGNKPRVRTRANTNQAPSKAPKQLEMFNKSGTVKAGIKKSNETAAKAAKKRTASEKRKATLQAKKDAIKRREAGVAKAKLTRAKNKEAAKKKTTRKRNVNRAITAASLGTAAASLSKSPSKEKKTTTKTTTNNLSKSRVPTKQGASQTPSQALAMKNRKKGIKPKDPSQRKTGVGSLSPSNYLKRKNKKMGVTGTGNRPYTAEEKARPSKKKKKPSGRPMDNMGGFGRSNRQKYLSQKYKKRK